jgi:RNA polymerase sigma factor for flagellar operon FliA
LATCVVPTKSDAPQSENYLYLVRAIARGIKRRCPPCVELDDLIGDGMVGLTKSLAHYDSSVGAPFASYARHRIRGEILDGMRRMDWTTKYAREHHLATTEAVHVSIEGNPDWSSRLQSDQSEQDVFSIAVRAEEETRVARLLAQLPPRWAAVLRAYYWEGLDSKVIAKGMRVSEARVSQIIKFSLRRLRRLRLICVHKKVQG